MSFPTPVLSCIFHFLSLSELGRAAQVCRKWDQVAKSNVVWKMRLPIENPDRFLSNKTFYKLLSKNMAFHALERQIIFIWNRNFICDDLVNYQRRGPDNFIKINHSQNISCSLTSGNAQFTALFTGSFDHSIKFFQLNPLEFRQTLMKHQGTVTALCLNNTHLISGSTDRTICTWKWDKKNRIYTLDQLLEGHEGIITCLGTYKDGEKGVLFSGSNDKTVKIWKRNEENFELFQNLKHPYEVAALEVIEIAAPLNQIICGDSQGSVHIWKEQHNRLWSCTQTFEAHNSPITKIFYHAFPGTIITIGGKEVKRWKEGLLNCCECDEPILDLKYGHFSPIDSSTEISILTSREVKIIIIDNNDMKWSRKAIAFPEGDVLG